MTESKRVHQKEVKLEADCEQTNQAMSILSRNAHKRSKELNCLWAACRLVHTQNYSLNRILQGIVELIAPAWQYSDIAGARLILGKKRYHTKNFRETIWRQAQNITVDGKKRGTVEVCYLEDRALSDEGPFLKEEQSLLLAIAELVAGLIEYKEAQDLLEQTKAELDSRTKELAEAKTGLRVLLHSLEEAKEEIEERFLINVKTLVTPNLQKLNKTRLNSEQKAYLEIVDNTLAEITSPFVQRLSTRYLGLTPTEIEVANLIKDGKSTQEIADLLHVSPRTVEFHRQHMREKLGIKDHKANLRTMLLYVTS